MLVALFAFYNSEHNCLKWLGTYRTGPVVTNNFSLGRKVLICAVLELRDPCRIKLFLFGPELVSQQEDPACMEEDM